MKSLRQHVEEARAKKVAIGHFNISNLEGLHAVFAAASKLSVPVIIGVSEGERDFVGLAEVAALVRTIREKYDYPIFLNADHSYSLERVKAAIEAGFDMAIFDGAKLSLDDNIATTKQCVDFAREYSQREGRDVLIEGELGYIGQSSEVRDSIPDGVMKTNPEDAKKFVEMTGVDLLAPAVGNIHGMLKSGVDPKLDIALVGEITEATHIPLVLHGGSGNSDEDFRAAIAAGVTIVHINTELRLAWKNALALSLSQNPDEVAPYKLLAGAVTAMEQVAEHKLKIFNNL